MSKGFVGFVNADRRVADGRDRVVVSPLKVVLDGSSSTVLNPTTQEARSPSKRARRLVVMLLYAIIIPTDEFGCKGEESEKTWP